MTVSERLELIRAGYSKEEIESMINPQNPQNNPQEKETSVDSEKPESQAQESEKETSVHNDPAPDENKPDSTLKAFQDSIKEMIKSNQDLMRVIQDSNLKNDSHGNNSIDDINHKAEDVLKSIIAHTCLLISIFAIVGFPFCYWKYADAPIIP